MSVPTETIDVFRNPGRVLERTVTKVNSSGAEPPEAKAVRIA
jgi:hypothetical protein